MNKKACIGWLEEVIATKPTKLAKSDGYEGGRYYDATEASAWVTEGQSAIETIFPVNHTISKRWRDNKQQADRPWLESETWRVDAWCETMKVGAKLLAEGRLSTIIDGVRAETETEVLDQASELLSAGHLVAATVLAGRWST